jgi:predicted enzyme related to lactoylglutathione lyase
MNRQTPGTVGWVDLTVPDAVAIRDFYARVTGWTPSAVSMGEYEDFCMHAASGEMVAGICHARGENRDIPPVWLIYIAVEDLEQSVQRCTESGGKLRAPVRGLDGQGSFCIIEDPAGAVVALFQPAARAA